MLSHLLSRTCLSSGEGLRSYGGGVCVACFDYLVQSEHLVDTTSTLTEFGLLFADVTHRNRGKGRRMEESKTIVTIEM